MIAEQKKIARKAALERRAKAAQPMDLRPHITPLAQGYKTIAFYMPIGTELDPRPAMMALAGQHQIAVPVVLGRAQPLKFCKWTPDTKMIEGAFGAMIPQAQEEVTPDLVIAPLLAFDAHGTRLGYGGGFYDRTIEKLRNQGACAYWGLAFSAQESPTLLPKEPTDIPLDGVVTENGLQQFRH